MIPKYKVMLISLVVFLPLLFTIPSTESNQSSNKTSSYTIPFSSISSTVKYSTFVDQNKSTVDVFTIYPSNSSLVLSNYALTLNSGSTSNNFIVNITTFLGSDSVLIDYNYFVSNNTKFLILTSKQLSTYSNNINFTIFDLSNNLTFGGFGNVYYHISSINRFSNSPDVYFSIYNSTTYLLVKYSFQTNSFSTILIKTFPTNNLVQIMDVRTVMIQDKFYISITTGSSDNNLNNYTSYMYIFDKQGMIFNKAFSSVAVTSFTTEADGLLLFSSYNSTFYQYSYSNDSVTQLNIQSTFNSNPLAFSAYDNNSFLILGYDSFELMNIISLNYFQDIVTYSVQNNNNQNLIQAITLNGNKYYLFSGFNQNNFYEIFFASILDGPPTDFVPTTGMSIITSTTNPYNPIYNTQNNPTVYYTTTTTTTNDFFSIVFFALLFFVIIGAIVVSSKRNRANQYYRPRNDSYLQRNQYYPRRFQQNQHNQQSFAKRITLSCIHCGWSTEPGDIFCQNCGERL